MIRIIQFNFKFCSFKKAVTTEIQIKNQKAKTEFVKRDHVHISIVPHLCAWAAYMEVHQVQFKYYRRLCADNI